ncbi:gamma-glutamylcyclotransferase [Fibrisoma montanum]|uniref:Gamma-glutamylcyclotransferase n=1 Tax=Fibrisoma montanum TaxID=2305895 RepID=A0A418M862_9BACT|nr:gamma-glutamylcyclotransferase family protein [Fibrisoma montanum]RIV22251.1 gamma-glutamylcyclotransferase [Fibrisoma montanum]
MPPTSSTSVMDLLFVYGTLRRGAHNETATYLHQRSTYVGTGYLPGKLFEVDWYPGAVYQPTEANSTGPNRSDVPSDLTRSRSDGTSDPYVPLTNHVPLITGDVFRLHHPAEMLTFLDDYEDVSADGTGLYVRELLPVTLLGQPITAWVYLYNRPVTQLVLIESGDFLPYL